MSNSKAHAVAEMERKLRNLQLETLDDRLPPKQPSNGHIQMKSRTKLKLSVRADPPDPVLEATWKAESEEVHDYLEKELMRVRKTYEDNFERNIDNVRNQLLYIQEHISQYCHDTTLYSDNSKQFFKDGQVLPEYLATKATNSKLNPTEENIYAAEIIGSNLLKYWEKTFRPAPQPPKPKPPNPKDDPYNCTGILRFHLTNQFPPFRPSTPPPAPSPPTATPVPRRSTMEMAGDFKNEHLLNKAIQKASEIEAVTHHYLISQNAKAFMMHPFYHEMARFALDVEEKSMQLQKLLTKMQQSTQKSAMPAIYRPPPSRRGHRRVEKPTSSVATSPGTPVAPPTTQEMDDEFKEWEMLLAPPKEAK